MRTATILHIVDILYVQKSTVSHCSERLSCQGQATPNIGDQLQGQFVFIWNLV